MDISSKLINHPNTNPKTEMISVTGKNISNIKDEFGLDPVTVNKRKFSVSKRCIPDYGFEHLKLVDYLLFLGRGYVTL